MVPNVIHREWRGRSGPCRRILFAAVLCPAVCTWLPNLATAGEVHVGYIKIEAPAPVPAGIKGKVVSAAVKVLAKMIRHGGEYVGKVVRYLDDDAARAFRKHSKKIAKELDRIAEIPDLTTRIVKEQLYNFLKNTVGLSGGTAMEIADAVKAVLDWIIF